MATATKEKKAEAPEQSETPGQEEQTDSALTISIGDPEKSILLDLADTRPNSTTASVLTGAAIGAMVGVAGLALNKSGKLSFTIPDVKFANKQQLGMAFVAATTALGGLIPGLHSHKHNKWGERILKEEAERSQAEQQRA